MNKTRRHIPIRIALGIVATALIADFVTLLLRNPLTSTGAILGLIPCAILLAYAICMPRVNARIAALWRKRGAGRITLIVLAVLLSAGILLVIVETTLMCIYANRPAPKSETGRPPVVIVLGCLVKDGRPSTLLQDRIDTAADYLLAHPECRCIVSGGKGTDEEVSEARCMFDALVSAGISADRLIIEDRSTTTRENLRFCKEIMEREDLGDTAVIVTNSWHEFRAQMIASDLGLPCGAVGAPTAWWLLPANYLRELFAIAYQFVF